ncbi:hypothetical protein AMP1_24 [Burkholderia phage AMP1]|uniref:DNMP kinase n=5 Tax=Ampunavirus BpAMP1 TaxID=2733589 RepID=A0A5C2IBR2_9CAUD|nr:adenylyl-sulfate kinase [Burkholderia phage Bp-AMP1]QEP52851.1 hypothetical protein AMP1_24 [Burkholderia phage AMP1]CDL65182.1 hypothetical protein [Burkholderia phage Bp-AMP2]CDL65222.1 hypothetical protein [Burkholderia phage Bp-AMP3]CDL65250.1 hypothetical protein [Burkholderia phage Bp-AMP4]CDK30096.1 hypothetical protein [Burkholderia phage Bp-AMP1]
MARIIGLTGLAGAGKDTAAQAMQREITGAGTECRIGSFADPIRQISKLIGLEPYDRALKEKRRCMSVDDFCDSFQHAIDKVLGHRLSDEDRAALYCYTVEALDKFKYDDVIELSPREFMQVFGTEGGQSVSQSLWVDLATSLWHALPGVVLVPDTRFAHELMVLDDLILVVRPGTIPPNGHVSERLALRLMEGADPRTIAPGIRFYRLYNNRPQQFFERAAEKLAAAFVSYGV